MHLAAWERGPTPSPAEQAELRIGDVLRGKWTLEKLIGVGGVAAVYEARHRNGRRVAVKLLHDAVAHVPEVRERFARESAMANEIQHRGVVEVLDDDVDDHGTMFLVLELLSGETIDARWHRKGRLALNEVLSIADQLLDVLAAAHARGFVHRDIKPANLFLTKAGTVKLLDFGLARLPEGAAALTLHNQTMGTPAFMAPEQALGQNEHVDARTDLWAVGATMLTLLSGRYLHEGQSLSAVLMGATQPAPRARSLVPGMPAPVAELIDRALAFDPDARWPGARAMQRAVREAFASSNLSGRVGLPSSVPPPRVNSPRDWAYAAALFALPVVLAAALGIAWGSYRAPSVGSTECVESVSQ